MEIAQVKDVMTDTAITVGPDATIETATKLITENKFNGVPVIDANKKLVGLVTEYNLINELMNGNAKDIMMLKTAEVMDKTPLTLYFDDTYETALKLFNDHHSVNPVPVIDHDSKLVGVLSRYDMLKLIKIYGHS